MAHSRKHNRLPLYAFLALPLIGGGPWMQNFDSTTLYSESATAEAITTTQLTLKGDDCVRTESTYTDKNDQIQSQDKKLFAFQCRKLKQAEDKKAANGGCRENIVSAERGGTQNIYVVQDVDCRCLEVHEIYGGDGSSTREKRLLPEARCDS